MAKSCATDVPAPSRREHLAGRFGAGCSQASRHPDSEHLPIPIQSIFHWRAGTLLRQPDDLILQAAAEDGLTLVTYDQKTIPPLLIAWGAAGIEHSGVIFIDQHTIRSNDIGGLVRAIERFWDRECREDWKNRMDFLDAP